MSLSVATSLLKPLETSSSLGLFARDTGGCLISRLSLSRSNNERKEVSMSEISESLIFYFSAPLLAKLTGKLFNNLTNDKNLAKTGQILSTFSVILPLVYAIAPFRNLMTLSKTGQDEFVSVVGLKKEDNKKDKKEQAKEKGLDLLKKISLVSLSSLAMTGALFGACKNDKIHKSLEPVLKKFAKTFEFSDKNDLKLMHYAALIYPASILGYFKASRDKYEVMENVRRFCVTVPLLFLGDKVIEKPIHKFFDKCFNTNVLEGNEIKSYKDILKLPQNQQKEFLKTKNWAFALTFLISTMFVAGGVALLNRIQTKKNYEKDNELKNKN
ncbi:MAG: hypothetical protein IJ877_02435 [Candidatus Gastranaerophilales bacterium]|nr:hypothetical protein [Candidatus Gastranaerophilales bacterium]